MSKIQAVIIFVALTAYGLIGATGVFAGSKITASQASEHVGESATVCGQVASARFATNSNGQPTFLNLDKAYPKHIFTAVIFGDYRGNFDYAPESLKGAYICVTGRIDQYKGKPQVKVRNSKQIEIR